MIGEDGRMTEPAPERFVGMTRGRRAAGRRRRAARGRPALGRGAVHPLGPVLAPLRRADRAADLAAVVLRDGRARQAGDRGRRERRGPITPERWKRVYLDWMEGIRPWCVSRQLWWGHRLPVWYCAPARRPSSARIRAGPGSCEQCDGELRQDPDVLDTWFSSALWPFATLGWPEDTPELRAFYPTDLLSTARDIIFLWVARMIMTGIEFTGEIPFNDVYVHSVIQAPDGRRMSKSLGTGIDPLEEIDKHGADALRFGLLAMSSTQDVRFSRGQGPAGPRPRQQALERLAADPAERRRSAAPAAPTAARRPRTAGSSRGSSARSTRSRRRSTTTTSPTPRWSSTASSGRSSATGTWRSSSRASTTATRPPRRTSSTCSSGRSRWPTR